MFADDTSISERCLDVQSFNKLVNIDLCNISVWSKKWLVKLNPDKTEIVYFSHRAAPNDLVFAFDDSSLSPVDQHKHRILELYSVRTANGQII